jgi:hypothetical protein
MEKSKQEVELKNYYIKTASKIPFIIQDAYDLLFLFIKKTTIQKQNIPSEAFRILENQGRKPLDVGNMRGNEARENQEEKKE